MTLGNKGLTMTKRTEGGTEGGRGPGKDKEAVRRRMETAVPL